MIRLAILDIDDTLFDWLGMWSVSFTALFEAVRVATGSDNATIKATFRSFHVQAGTSEYPYSAADLNALFPPLARHEAERLAIDLERDRATRHVFFPEIENVLHHLRTVGVQIVLHTDAPPLIAARRAKTLGLARWADAICSTASPHLPDPQSSHTVLEHRKPDVKALRAILDQHGIPADHAVYIGDSIYKDIAMAQACGVRDVHAAYGCRRDSNAYGLLREVSHWTDADIEFERSLSLRGDVKPTFIAQSSAELMGILRLLLA